MEVLGAAVEVPVVRVSVAKVVAAVMVAPVVFVALYAVAVGVESIFLFEPLQPVTIPRKPLMCKCE